MATITGAGLDSLQRISANDLSDLDPRESYVLDFKIHFTSCVWHRARKHIAADYHGLILLDEYLAVQPKVHGNTISVQQSA